MPIKATSDVRSWPDRAGTNPGFPAKTKRVTAPSLSPMLLAIALSPYSFAAAGLAIAASKPLLTKSAAAAAVEEVGIISASG